MLISCVPAPRIVDLVAWPVFGIVERAQLTEDRFIALPGNHAARRIAPAVAHD